MIKFALISQTTLSSLIVAGSFIGITFPVSALTWNIAGTFEDNGTITGSFNYDGSNYSNINITTTGGDDNTSGNLVPVGTTYNNIDNLFGAGVTGFAISNDDFGFDLDLVLETDISTTPEIINLDVSTEETDYNNSGNTRGLSSGTITSVPFEPSANLAILTLLGLMGFHRYRKRFRD